VKTIITAQANMVGNKGGDYITITQTKAQAQRSCFFIEVGHCCVVTLRAVVPVEFLTSLITKFMLTDADGMGRSTDAKLSDFAREVLNYSDKSFVDERLSKIVERGFWNV